MKQKLNVRDSIKLNLLEITKFIVSAKSVEVVILNQDEDTTFEEDLKKDFLEIITVFSARLYGSRSYKNQKLLEDVVEAVKEHANST